MTEPRQMDCHAAANRLYDYLDGELTSEVEVAVRDHLAECAPCFSLFGFEQAYVTFLKARTQARRAPAHLRKRVFEQILFDREPPEQQ